MDNAIKQGFIKIIGELDSLSEQYASSDVVFLPIEKPHQQRSIFEAGLFCKPVIVPNFDCLVEGVTDGVSGFLYQSEDTYSAIKAFERLHCDRSLIGKMGLKGNERAVENHSFKVYQQTLITRINAI
tara:strand:- start:658 stop:1038 length:381 start_codon:yes stop_codon:yes gene_type:complete